MIEVSNWVHSPIGEIHTLAAVIGLVTGAFILLTRKGTKLHKKWAK